MKQPFVLMNSLFFVFLLVFSSCVQAAVINVPANYATIAQAVAASESGDTILVQPGTYSITKRILIGKSVTIASLYQTTDDESYINETVLDCRDFDEGHPLSIWEGSYSNGEKKYSTLDPDEQVFVVLKEDPGEPVASVRFIGLHFRGNNNVSKPIVSHGELYVSHCRISDFHSDSISFESYGSGHGYVGYCTVENTGDEAIDLDATHGGTFEIEHNRFINGRGDDLIEIRLAPYTDIGAGIMAYNIHHNSFEGVKKAGIQLIDYDVTTDRIFSIHHNIFSNMGITGLSCMAHKNTKEDGKGAALAERVLVYNNTFDGAKYCITGGNNMVVLNNIFTNCSEVAVKRVNDHSIVDYNIFSDNDTDIENSITGTHLLYADPQLDALHKLEEGSPCIDAGTSHYEWQGETVLNIPPADYIPPAPDIGAFEYGDDGPAGNNPPSVFAGFSSVIVQPDNSITMTGATATDDGLPENSTLAVIWSKVSGPGTVNFDDNTVTNPTVTFGEQGAYTLSLTASDGEYTSNATVDILYVQDGNGFSRTVDMPSTVCFEAEEYSYLVAPVKKITDQEASGSEALEAPAAGAGYADYRLTTTGDGSYYVWLLMSGADENSNAVTVSFKGVNKATVSVDPHGRYSWVKMPGSLSTTAGNWPLVLQGEKAGVKWDKICISTDSSYIPPADGPTTKSISIPISNSTDDAEEGNDAPGKMYLNSSDLELVTDDVPQTVGLRFPGIAIPRGSSIISASVQFTVDEDRNAPCDLTIQGEARPDAATFTSDNYNISSRPRTGSLVAWSPPQWENVGDANDAQKTPDLSAIIKEIINQEDWHSGNALALIITGTGKRVAVSHDGSPEAAPMLTIKFRENQAPDPGAKSLTLPIKTKDGKVIIIQLQSSL